MMYLGIRIAAGCLWSAAVMLMIVGTCLSSHVNQLACYAWGVMIAFAAMVATIYVIAEHMHDRNRRLACRDISTAVGMAVGQHLAARDLGPRGLGPHGRSHLSQLQ